MKILRPGVDLDTFFAEVRGAPRRGLLLDYDGTLAPFADDRMAAWPYPGVRELLRRLIQAGGSRVVIVSGRPVSDVLHLLRLQVGCEIWGVHGWERLRDDGSDASMRPAPEQRDALRKAQALVPAALRGALEEKSASLALHWRGTTPDARQRLEQQMRPAWSALAQREGLELHGFDGGLELRIPGRDKGLAVRTIAEELGPGGALAYLGDDLTDEDAFRAMRGHGLGVLVREALRPTEADCWIVPPEELLAFLERWLHSLPPA
ncbi:MAG: trehalose-phosphatase [Candidatus Lambdaproteobacteria bacterium]|nr:trehalose-phosphatase [Candidatus Lambdaproteobacteria bacterium]